MKNNSSAVRAVAALLALPACSLQSITPPTDTASDVHAEIGSVFDVADVAVGLDTTSTLDVERDVRESGSSIDANDETPRDAASEFDGGSEDVRAADQGTDATDAGTMVLTDAADALVIDGASDVPVLTDSTTTSDVIFACDSGMRLCGGRCTSLLNDVANCGACGLVCAGPRATSERCEAGVCRVVSCADGFADCDLLGTNGCESDLASDRANCGRCGFSCDASNTCVAGSCVARCLPGETRCGGGCVDTSVDPSHCGACGATCAEGAVCCDGACVAPADTSLVLNGGFEAPDVVFPPDASAVDGGWVTYFFRRDIDYGTCMIDTTGVISGFRHLRCDVNTVLPPYEGWHFIVNQGGVALIHDQQYLLRFRARSASVRALEVSVQPFSGPGTYRPAGNLRVTTATSWRWHGACFRADLLGSPIDMNAKVVFWLLSGGAGTTYIDDVALFRLR